MVCGRPVSRQRLFVPLDADEAAALAPLRARHRSVVVVRRSLDSRRGRAPGYDLELALDEEEPHERLPPVARATRPLSVVIVGAGPAGTFAALRLSEAGAHVTIVEQGKPVQPRRHDLAKITRGALDPTSNYCFGEGGAGTFSDGKLYTRVKDRAGVGSVLQTLVEHGADPSIEVDSRPHIGSNKLPPLLVQLREALIARGVVYHWEESVDELLIGEGARVRGVRCRSGREILADATVLAVGHSARSLYEALHRQQIALTPKPFAIGARIEHPQPFIDRAQYGRAFEHPKLPAAFYHVTAQVDPTAAGHRGVYSFCMCPGGWVVNSSTEEGRLCTNGMSLSRRDSPRANAALVVTVEPRDYLGAYGEGPLAGLAMQRAIEEKAFVLGGGGYVAAAQRLKDFIANRPSTTAEASSYRPSIVPGDVRSALPSYLGDALALALQQFDKSLRGFLHAEAQLVGVETRSSSPVRILRRDDGQSPSHAALFPIAEGAGYAGGIVSAAIDGLHAADRIVAAFG